MVALIRRPALLAVIAEPDVELALKLGWPSMFAATSTKRSTTANASPAISTIGDLVKRDADGYLWFVSPRHLIVNPRGI